MTTLTFTALCLGAFFVFLFAYNYAVNYHARMLCERKDYEKHYCRLQQFIHEAPVTPENYDRIERMFCRLHELPHRNHEKSSVLYVAEFLVKFEKEIQRRRTAEMEIKSGDEFSPHEVFRKY